MKCCLKYNIHHNTKTTLFAFSTLGSNNNDNYAVNGSVRFLENGKVAVRIRTIYAFHASLGIMIDYISIN